MALFIVIIPRCKRSLAELGVDCGGGGDSNENGLLNYSELAAHLHKV